MRFSLFILFVVTTLFSCKTQKDIVYTSPVEVDYDEELLDTLVVSASPITPEVNYTLPPYNPEATRTYDIVHTKLELAFDWTKQHVLGKAHIDIQPIFYPVQQITLDAKQFIINKVSLGKTGKGLSYEYNDFFLDIDLGKTYQRGEKFTIYIDYVARPNEGPQGGSAAITSDKGLFFINPTGEIEGKPRQIWTQGETENNSKWFPTFDKPNERCTQEIYLTVEEGLETLSNGELINSVKNGDGTKTDYWKMDLPHAPYLFMLAIGDFARVQDKWNGKQLEYMVDPPYEPSAKEIFNHTPEMLTFFSELLDYPYPWNKYSQVICEDYVSGAMENTTGVIFGDFVQKTKRELIDNENDQIVAHEMFHHWFGDLVTCESWANLTLNEGFANYSEYLWYEHKYGKDAADAIRVSEMEGYFGMTEQTGTHPLIHYGYNDKEDMFDAHSYNKGGLVLHMLRNHVGDDAFFAALSKYLKDNQFTAVETAELRIAFEDVTGQDWNWFFDQWYLDKGHPTLEVSYDYSDGNVMIYVEQTQDVENHRPVFILPLDAAIYAADGSVSYYPVVIDERRDTIVLSGINEKPIATVLDGKSYMLGVMKEDRPQQEWASILEYSPNHFDKRTALSKINTPGLVFPMADKLLKNEHYIIRSAGIEYATEDQYPTLRKMITDDPHSSVRSAALYRLYDDPNVDIISQAEVVFKNDPAYEPMQTALSVIYEENNEKGLQLAETLKSDPSPNVAGFLTTFFANTGNPKYIPEVQAGLEKISVFELFYAFGRYSDLLLGQENNKIMESVDWLENMSLNNSNIYRRYLSTNMLNNIRTKFAEENKDAEASTVTENEKHISRINSVIEAIMAKETDETLLSRYRAY